MLSSNTASIEAPPAEKVELEKASVNQSSVQEIATTLSTFNRNQATQKIS